MKLFLVGMPLGNVEDISLRAVRLLKEAKLIICEDSRVFRRLWLKLAGMGYLENEYLGKLEILNDYNEKRVCVELTKKISKYGEALLVSDAGMPTISDPGFGLIKSVLMAGGEISCVPGPSALTAAVSLSGLSADRLLFLGFLPKKKSKRTRGWEAVRSFSKFKLGLTVVIYEPARSVYKTLSEIEKEFGDVQVVIVREITKRYEEVIRGRAKDVLSEITDRKIKGEVVLLWRLKKGGRSGYF